jgi:hypothetical protein
MGKFLNRLAAQTQKRLIPVLTLQKNKHCLKARLSFLKSSFRQMLIQTSCRSDVLVVKIKIRIRVECLLFVWL